MDENNNNPNTPNPQNDFDLDAALEEKFQQVQQDLDRLRAMNANADAQQAAESADVRRKSLQRKRQLRKSLCRRQNQRKMRRSLRLPKRRYRKLHQRQIRRRTKNPPESGRLAIN